MVNICYMVDAPYAGGAERYIALLARSLDRAHFRVSVFARRAPGLAGWLGDLETQGVQTVAVPIDLPFHPGSIPRVVESIRSLAPHVVHVNMPGPYDAQMGLLLPIARAAGAARVIVTEHLPMVERLWKRAFVKRISYCWLDRMLTVCEANVPFLVGCQGVPPEKITVVHNALPIEYGAGRAGWRPGVRSELGIEDGQVAVCIVGSLIKRKGHALLIDALSGIGALPWRLVVVGDGEERSACERQLRTRELLGRALMVGHQSTGAVERLLSGMDLMAVPSLMEAFPYTILEAMACGLPVVASRIYGIPEAAVEGETALLVDPGDRDALAGALARLISDAALRERLGRSGRARFERAFTLDGHTRRMQSMYLELIDSQRVETHER
jgi:glycosyltransferase involved in cell wall biosynthesis